VQRDNVVAAVLHSEERDRNPRQAESAQQVGQASVDEYALMNIYKQTESL
jgi:hypothetical protein